MPNHHLDLPRDSAIALVSCPLQRGVAAKMTHFVYDLGSDIIEHRQYVDTERNHLFARLAWQVDSTDLSRSTIENQFRESLAEPLGMQWSLHFSGDAVRMAVFVTREMGHLYTLIMRCVSGLWNAVVPLIISNQPDLAAEAERFGIEFHHVPITKDNKPEQEERELCLLQQQSIELVVLARYMQVLTERLITPFRHRIINIHHSMLPAFAGPKPYLQAHERGVKLIGATSHFVTADLDEGPIIVQDVAYVNHRKTVPQLIKRGRDLEMTVLARAVDLYLDRRIVVDRKRTIVFD
jgi:formyltetrahydrofolate deformylase